MSTAVLDILGMYSWDNTIFDNMVLPDELEASRTDIVNNILYECRGLEITLPSPVALKKMIELWSKKRLYYFTELYKTTLYEYNPIDNYDRYEDVTDISNGTTNDHTGTTVNRDGTDTVTTTKTGSDTVTTTRTGTETKTNTGTNTHDDELKVAAFDSSTYENSDHRVITDTPNTTETTTPNLTEIATDVPNTTETTVDTPNLEERSQSTSIGSNSGTLKHTAHIRGKIGIKTTQSMILEQRDIVNISLIELIGKDFKNEFCILVY